MVESRSRARIAQEAARILCESGVLDYGLAKSKAMDRLGTPSQGALPTNVEIQAAMLEYQALFGGEAVTQRLQQLRQVALNAMRMLDEHDPRLVGAVLSGAIGLEPARDRVQLHVFDDAPETLDLLLLNRGVPFEIDERRFQWRRGQAVDIPLLRFELDDTEIELAVFPNRGRGHAPLSLVDGQPMARADRAQVVRLLSEPPGG